jgi:ferredoxin
MNLAANEARCTGCRTCELVCAFSRYGQMSPKMAALRVKGEFPAPGTYHLSLCTQCGVCADACPEGAIGLQGEAYLIDADLCTRCGVCVEECPEGALFEHKGADTPIKCDLCGECVEICPRDVLSIAGAPVLA